MDKDLQELYNRGKKMEQVGKAMQSQGQSIANTGCAMTMGCLMIFIILLLIVMFFIFI